MLLVAVLNAARNAVSFYLLLIVSLGYGVVKPSLGRTMRKCVLLGLVHFAFGILYTVGSMVTRKLSPFAVFIYVLPLSTSMTIFYYWSLTSLENTMKELQTRKQTVKLQMYKNLSRIIVVSVAMLFIVLLVNTVYFSNRNNSSWLPTHWQWKWLLMDGLLNLLYLFALVGILWLWRPTDNNRRYGLDELAQDDFEPQELDDFVAPFEQTGAFTQSMALDVENRAFTITDSPTSPFGIEVDDINDAFDDERIGLDRRLDKADDEQDIFDDENQVLNWTQGDMGYDSPKEQ